MRSTQEVLNSKAALFADVDVPRITKKEPWNLIVEKLKNPNHTVLVGDEYNKLIGIITDQDILSAITRPDLSEKLSQNQVTALDIMTPLYPEKTDTVVQSTDTLEDVIAKLQGDNIQKRPFKVVPVVDNAFSIIGLMTRDSIRENLDKLL